LRLNDDKRRKLKIDDVIKIWNEDDSFKARVVNLHKYKNFSELADNVDIEKTGFKTKKDLLLVLEEFYSVDSQKKFGVVGIEIVKI
jgi:ASC-1-like (ASCH) protein